MESLKELGQWMDSTVCVCVRVCDTVPLESSIL